jgi:hypothetical protein
VRNVNQGVVGNDWFATAVREEAARPPTSYEISYEAAKRRTLRSSGSRRQPPSVAG